MSTQEVQMNDNGPEMQAIGDGFPAGVEPEAQPLADFEAHVVGAMVPAPRLMQMSTDDAAR
ncbi:MAG: hypothetical protein Q8R28_16100, partial [Dehalococcoidia bacterium]|nr:hypothetical protein [Dehalococcoidia bacterium]